METTAWFVQDNVEIDFDPVELQIPPLVQIPLNPGIFSRKAPSEGIKAEPVNELVSENLLQNAGSENPFKKIKLPLLRAPQKSPQFLKCKDCPYLTMCQQRFGVHTTAGHPESGEQSKFNCPGCANLFFHRNSLEVHLLNDHKVDAQEVQDMLNMLALPVPTQTTTKSRIYIKSVDVLRNPSFIERQSIDAAETTQSPSPIETPSPSIPVGNIVEELAPEVTAVQRQKIYLKNVNELQEQQQTNLFQTDFDQFQTMSFQSHSQLSFPMQSDFNAQGTINAGESLLEHLPQISFSNNPMADLPDHPSTTPSKNKIYIRNVQTLIRPEVQEHSQLGAGGGTIGSPNTTAYLHLRSLDDIMNLEEVQSLPPQRNDIVVLDDFHEPQIHSAPFFVPQQPQQIPSTSPVDDVQVLEENVNSCVVEEGLKILSDSQSFNLQQHNGTEQSNFIGVFRTEPTDEQSSFYYKNLEDNLSQLIFSSQDIQENIQPDAQSDSIPELQCQSKDAIRAPKDDRQNDLNTPRREEEEEQMMDNVICLPDESDVDENPITLPQLPRIFIANNLTETSNVNSSQPPLDCPTNETKSLSKRSRGRPKGGRNYAKDGRDFPHICPTSGCPRKFREVSNLEYHKRCHGPDGIICPECETKEISKWNILHTHLWRKHSIDMELYSCSLCNFKTPCLSSLNNTHSKIHSEEKAFDCDFCGKQFKNQKQLKNHKRHHRLSNQKTNTTNSKEKAKEIKCNLCELDFENDEHLKKHNFQFHLKVRNRCQICSKPFLRAIDLQVHIRTSHSQEKETVPRKNKKEDGRKGVQERFKCDECPYETSHRNSAKRHRMVHNGEKKYKCDFCDYSCIQSNSFRSHILKVHPDNAVDLIFKCPVCVFTTINKGQFNVHVAKHGQEIAAPVAEFIMTEEQQQPQRETETPISIHSTSDEGRTSVINQEEGLEVEMIVEMGQ